MSVRPAAAMASVETEPPDDPPWGIRSLARLDLPRAAGVGDEAADLVALRDVGLPAAPAWVVSLSAGEGASRLARAVALAMARRPGSHVTVRPLFPTRALAARFARHADMTGLVEDPSGTERVARELIAVVSVPEVTAALGGSLARLSVLVTATDPGPVGRAASADPVDGDPDRLRVWESAVTPWLVDRRNMQVTARGEGYIDEPGASQVADLADRAQLVLGRPVEISWAMASGRPVVTGVRPLSLAPRFTPAPYRIVMLISDDEGCVAPLAIDALDKAVQREGELPDEHRVRRIYARPYRRVEERPTRLGRNADPASLARATARAARVAADLAAPLGAARRFERELEARLAALDAQDLVALDAEALVEGVRARQRLVIEAMVLLDRVRLATVAVLAALEATVGTLPSDCFPAFGRPRLARSRRRLYDRMQRLTRRIEQEHGELIGREKLSQPLARRWDELRHELAGLRPLGIDVRPVPFGRDDATMVAALRAAPWDEDESRERARRDALRRISATARHRPLGRAREGIATSLGLLASRVARSKGVIAEGLAAALLRTRSAACEAGRRLEIAGLVDDPEDAFYLSLAEIEQGLAGEPGAYAARVRLRREDDLRWARYNAPRRIDRSGVRGAPGT